MEVKKIFLFSGQPKQGKTTIANEFELPVISLDEVFLIWYNELTKMDHRGFFSIPTVFKLLPQSHITDVLNTICKEIDTFLKSEQSATIIDGWMLFFYKESLKKLYPDIKFIDVFVHEHCCYVDGVVYKNENISDIKKNIVEPIVSL